MASPPAALRAPRAAPARRAAPRRSRASRILWALWVLVELPLVAFVATGVAAAYLPSGPFWWAQLAAVGLPYAAGALAAASVVPAFARRWGWAGLHLLLVGIVAWRALPGRLGAPQPLGAAAEGDLVVMTFNLPTYGPSREELADSVVAFVNRTKPDILLMQDAWAYVPVVQPSVEQSVQVESVVSRLPYRLALPRNPGPTDAEGATGVPVIVRTGSGLDVIEQEHVRLGDDDEASASIRSHLRWQGRDVVLYNVHLRSFGEQKPWNDPNLRLAEPASWMPYLRRYRGVYARRGLEAERLAARIEAETLPVLVTGDFNSTADNRTTHLLRTAGRPVGSPRLDAFREAGGRTWGRTYHAARPVVRIDFVLVDPAFAVVGADVSDVTFSDHRPVRAYLHWAAPADSARTEPPE